jgi:uncharacterized SAM-binding protein YcdF (DUF218 family)
MKLATHFTKHCKAIGIVLGGGVANNSTLPKDVVLRLEKAYELYTEKYVQTLILTGGCTNKKIRLSEAKVMYYYLLNKGIPKQDLLIEDKAKDTIGNAVYTKEMILKKNLHRTIILVTSDYHLKRALRLFLHIFGNGWIIAGAASHPSFMHTLCMMLREWEMKELETILLTTVPNGNHIHAKKFLKKLKK